MSDEDFYKFFDDLLFKAALTKVTLEMTDEQRLVFSGINLEGYYIWDLQMFVQEFIQRKLKELRIGIKTE